MPKILMLDPNPKSAVSFYRSIGTFSYLHRLDPNVHYELLSVYNWNTWMGADILYVQRPYADDHLGAIVEAQKCNVKVWVDTDDLLHEIPNYNPNHRTFNNPKEKFLDNFLNSVKRADVVTVTTEVLKDYYSEYNENVQIVENAHNDYAFPFMKLIGDSAKAINWRGSNTHRMDVLSVAQQIVNVREKHKDWKWIFVGNDLWYITELLKGNAIEIPEKPILTFFELLRTVGSSIQVVPLVDNNFNRAKSSISWIEATYGGMTTVAPNFPEFNKPGCLCYEGEEQFEYYLEKCIKSKAFRQENYEKSFKYIKENLLLSQVNRKRMDIINELRNK
ncbi:MAG: glycosyltransferase family 4 protein [PVC group bacterium]|nr:glycosyltransferase family 4 protein [PVC group bacterium]